MTITFDEGDGYEYISLNPAPGLLFGRRAPGPTLVRIHAASRCEGRHCPIHNPSEHALRNAPLNWRDDHHMMERICPHGIGHPDPDDLDYKRRYQDDTTWLEVHSCDGCCR